MTVQIIEVTNAYDSAEGALADWSFTENEEVMGVVERAARSIARKYEDSRTVEYDDAYQEALSLMATHRVLRNYDTLGILYHRLTQRLTHVYETEAKRRSTSKTVSWEQNNDKLAAQGY